MKVVSVLSKIECHCDICGRGWFISVEEAEKNILNKNMLSFTDDGAMYVKIGDDEKEFCPQCVQHFRDNPIKVYGMGSEEPSEEKLSQGEPEESKDVSGEEVSQEELEELEHPDSETETINLMDIKEPTDMEKRRIKKIIFLEKNAMPHGIPVKTWREAFVAFMQYIYHTREDFFKRAVDNPVITGKFATKNASACWLTKNPPRHNALRIHNDYYVLATAASGARTTVSHCLTMMEHVNKETDSPLECLLILQKVKKKDKESTTEEEVSPQKDSSPKDDILNDDFLNDCCRPVRIEYPIEGTRIGLDVEKFMESIKKESMESSEKKKKALCLIQSILDENDAEKIYMINKITEKDKDRAVELMADARTLQEKNISEQMRTREEVSRMVDFGKKRINRAVKLLEMLGYIPKGLVVSG